MVQRKLFTTNFTTIDRKRETAEQLRPRIFLVEYILTCKIFHDLFAVYRDNNAIKKSNTNETESEEKEVDGKKKLKRFEEYF